MSKAIIITGTDTDVGKTVAAAGIVMSIPGALYWKPVQAGTEGLTDMEAAQMLSGLPPERFLPEAYRLATPASPHLAARIDDVIISPAMLRLPDVSAPLVIEGAGGLMVPLSDTYLMIDLFASWRQPVILVARTRLGTINHSLLSIEALRARDIPIGGIIFSGEADEENERIIPRMTGVRSLGRLPWMETVDTARLHLAMQAHIDIGAITALLDQGR